MTSDNYNWANIASPDRGEGECEDLNLTQAVEDAAGGQNDQVPDGVAGAGNRRRRRRNGPTRNERIDIMLREFEAGRRGRESSVYEDAMEEAGLIDGRGKLVLAFVELLRTGGFEVSACANGLEASRHNMRPDAAGLRAILGLEPEALVEMYSDLWSTVKREGTYAAMDYIKDGDCLNVIPDRMTGEDTLVVMEAIATQHIPSGGRTRTLKAISRMGIPDTMGRQSAEYVDGFLGSFPPPPTREDVRSIRQETRKRVILASSTIKAAKQALRLSGNDNRARRRSGQEVRDQALITLGIIKQRLLALREATTRASVVPPPATAPIGNDIIDGAADAAAEAHNNDMHSENGNTFGLSSLNPVNVISSAVGNVPLLDDATRPVLGVADVAGWYRNGDGWELRGVDNVEDAIRGHWSPPQVAGVPINAVLPGVALDEQLAQGPPANPLMLPQAVGNAVGGMAVGGADRAAQSVIGGPGTLLNTVVEKAQDIMDLIPSQDQISRIAEAFKRDPLMASMHMMVGGPLQIPELLPTYAKYMQGDSNFIPIGVLDALQSPFYSKEPGKGQEQDRLTKAARVADIVALLSGDAAPPFEEMVKKGWPVGANLSGAIKSGDLSEVDVPLLLRTAAYSAFQSDDEYDTGMRTVFNVLAELMDKGRAGNDKVKLGAGLTNWLFGPNGAGFVDPGLLSLLGVPDVRNFGRRTEPYPSVATPSVEEQLPEQVVEETDDMAQQAMYAMLARTLPLAIGSVGGGGTGRSAARRHNRLMHALHGNTENVPSRDTPFPVKVPVRAVLWDNFLNAVGWIGDDGSDEPKHWESVVPTKTVIVRGPTQAGRVWSYCGLTTFGNILSAVSARSGVPVDFMYCVCAGRIVDPGELLSAVLTEEDQFLDVRARIKGGMDPKDYDGDASTSRTSGVKEMNLAVPGIASSGDVKKLDPKALQAATVAMNDDLWQTDDQTIPDWYATMVRIMRHYKYRVAHNGVDYVQNIDCGLWSDMIHRMVSDGAGGYVQGQDQYNGQWLGIGIDEAVEQSFEYGSLYSAATAAASGALGENSSLLRANLVTMSGVGAWLAANTNMGGMSISVSLSFHLFRALCGLFHNMPFTFGDTLIANYHPRQPVAFNTPYQNILWPGTRNIAAPGAANDMLGMVVDMLGYWRVQSGADSVPAAIEADWGPREWGVSVAIIPVTLATLEDANRNMARAFTWGGPLECTASQVISAVSDDGGVVHSATDRHTSWTNQLVFRGQSAKVLYVIVDHSDLGFMPTVMLPGAVTLGVAQSVLAGVPADLMPAFAAWRALASGTKFTAYNQVYSEMCVNATVQDQQTAIMLAANYLVRWPQLPWNDHNGANGNMWYDSGGAPFADPNNLYTTPTLAGWRLRRMTLTTSAGELGVPNVAGAAGLPTAVRDAVRVGYCGANERVLLWGRWVRLSEARPMRARIGAILGRIKRLSIHIASYADAVNARMGIPLNTWLGSNGAPGWAAWSSTVGLAREKIATMMAALGPNATLTWSGNDAGYATSFNCYGAIGNQLISDRVPQFWRTSVSQLSNCVSLSPLVSLRPMKYQAGQIAGVWVYWDDEPLSTHVSTEFFEKVARELVVAGFIALAIVAPGYALCTQQGAFLSNVIQRFQQPDASMALAQTVFLFVAGVGDTQVFDTPQPVSVVHTSPDALRQVLKISAPSNVLWQTETISRFKPSMPDPGVIMVDVPGYASETSNLTRLTDLYKDV